MNKKITVSVWLTTLIIAMAVTFSITMMIAMERFDTTVASVQQKELMYSKISEIDTYVRANEYYDIDETLLQDTIASGYIFGTGDLYARYYTAEAYTAWLAIESGEMMGIGVEIAKDPATGYAKVLTVYAGSPAEDLGIKAGYYITTIGDVEVKTLATTEQIDSALLGESGTTLSIEWINETMEAQAGNVVRRNYTETTISYELVGNNGYIRVRTFAESTASEIDYAVSQLQIQGASAIIFDLRNNEGGDLDYALECIALVCDEGAIASAEYGDGKAITIAESTTDGVSLPMVCIVNGKTAKGAELFAYSARSLSGASIVGSTTAGVWTIQDEPYRFSDGSAVVLTVAKLLAGDGACFEGVGVTVDVERALTSEEQQMFYTYTTQTDPQILKAITVADSLSGVATVEAVNNEAAQSEAAEPQGEDDVADAEITQDEADDEADDATEADTDADEASEE